MTPTTPDAAAVLNRPLDLPCGVRLKNRLVKAAMSDSLGDGAGNPTGAQMRLYERWAQGGAALSLIGEVQTGPHYPERPGNLVLVADADMAALQRLARRGAVNGAQIWPQLGHAGALAYPPLSARKGPSALDIAGLRCGGLSLEEVHELPGAYARAAVLAQKAGFGGVELHAGHGFLLSQFLSPLFNRREDAYGGSIENRFRIIGEVLEAIRHAVGGAFAIGIKINATDKLQGGLTAEEALQVVQLLDATSVDLIEISGGTYFPGAESSSDGLSASRPYFADFARHARECTRIPVVLTGGIRTREEAAQALMSGAADAVGLARAFVLDPSLGKTWLGDTGGDPAFPRFIAPPPDAITAWYTMRLAALAEDAEDRFDMSPEAALAAWEARDRARCARWQERFS